MTRISNCAKSFQVSSGFWTFQAQTLGSGYLVPASGKLRGNLGNLFSTIQFLRFCSSLLVSVSFQSIHRTIACTLEKFPRKWTFSWRLKKIRYYIYLDLNPFTICQSYHRPTSMSRRLGFRSEVPRLGLLKMLPPISPLSMSRRLGLRSEVPVTEVGPT